MKSAVLFVSLLTSTVSAFVPTQTNNNVATSLKAAPTFEDKPGAIPPIGYWDPAGLAKNEELFDQYRVAEIKHGRAAMLAVIGYIVPEIYRFGYDIAPGISTNDVRNGVAALQDIPTFGWMQIFFLIGFVDFTGNLGSYEWVRTIRKFFFVIIIEYVSDLFISRNDDKQMLFQN
jgi:hypothetical protein